MSLIKKYIYLSLTTALLAVLWSCQLPDGKTINGVEDIDEDLVSDIIGGLQEASIEFQELAKPNRVQAWVDQLVVKAQPGGQDMPQIGTLKEGEIVEYLYQRTLRKSEYTLRGQRYYEPWIFIRMNDGQMGWVHEGGIKYLGTDLTNLLTGGGGGTTTNPNARTRSVTSVANPSQDRLVIPGQRVGPITVNTTEEQIMGIYGPANVSRGVIGLPDQTETCTIVMNGTPDELRITWKDETFTKIKAVYITRPEGRWFTKQGLSVGLSLVDLTKVNKAPVSFYGFNWTYSGTVSSWRQGILAPMDKYFYVVLSPIETRANRQLLQNYQGNQVFTSNDQGIDVLGIHVSRVAVYLD